MNNRSGKRENTGLLFTWACRLLICYPRAWRERYSREMELVLQKSPIMLWTLFDLVLGALDARLHPDLLPGRIITMASRIRTSEVAIFCAFVAYAVTWFIERNYIRDPLSSWEPVVQLHPEIGIALTVVDGISLVVLLAMVAGALPVLYAILRNALREQQWKPVKLLAIPLIAAAVLLVYLLLLAGLSTQRASNGTPAAPFTPLALILQFILAVLLCASVIGGTIAVALAVSRSRFHGRLLRFVLFPSTVVTGGIVAGWIATFVLMLLVLNEAPQLQGLPGWMVILVVMTAASIAAISALQQGIRAAGSR